MPLNARAGNSFLLKTRLFRLDPSLFWNYSIKQALLLLKLQSVRKFLRKYLLFKKQKVDSTSYYGIEDPFPDSISKLRRFMGGGNGVPVVGCQEPLVVRMP